MPDIFPVTPAKAQPRPPISRSLHGEFIEQAIPDWLINATQARRDAFRAGTLQSPSWYRQASTVQRQALHTQAVASFAAQTRLDKAMASLQDIDHFAEPLLVKALKDQFNVTLDVNKTLLQLRQPVEVGILGIDVASYDVLKLPLLQAALHNFEASECKDGAFHESSGFIEQGPATGAFNPVSTSLTVAQFTQLCRTLDIGTQYQAYLKNYLQPQDAVAEHGLREKFITAQKTALRVAAEIALLKKDIQPEDYHMILSVVAGEQFPTVGGKPVWFRDLSLMKHRMTGCVLFMISEKYRYTDEWILYIPHDPQSPLKRYTGASMASAFKQRFTRRDATTAEDGSPTPYQRFFSRFVAYADLPDYFSQLTEDAPNPSFKHKVATYTALFNELAKGFNPFAVFTGIRNLPPLPQAARKANPDPYLAPREVTREGHGLWAENVDLWTYLFDQYRAKVIADARAHAVPAADADAKARSEKFARLLNIGMLLFTAVTMFVPVLGELMLVVMAGQLLYETFEGALEWSEGARRAAKAHLLDVAENLALLAVTAGAGKAFVKLAGVNAEPVIENLDAVTLPNDQTRLWKADLSGYEHSVSLTGSANPLGQYELNGKTFIRLDGKAYETTWDPSLKRWRMRHPTDADAYQPLLTHNHAGAWRHTLERPLSWDRLTLLRRMGPVTQAFTDEQLLRIADVSGVDDNTLRKMHVDNALPPPALTDAMRLFDADQGVDQVLEQLEGARPINGRYLYGLPLVTQMPRWPVGRVLEVFEGDQLSGPSIKYGSELRIATGQRKAALRITRADVLGGQLTQRIIEQLDEAEITRLLGGEPARVSATRPQEFAKQLAHFARTRQPAIFDSLYTGTERQSPWVARLQRECPGLSVPAAQTVLADADGAEHARMQDTGKVPLRLLEQARWYAQQGRLGQAYAGLHLENMVSADSRRLALSSLAELPGWTSGLRLEVREGTFSGPQLDAIGPQDAASRKVLVKQGPGYQAFDEQGESLHSVTPGGKNFYTALMQALPDETRSALGVPQVNQHAQLQRLIIDEAVAHPDRAAQVIAERSRVRGGFKPPQRISDTLIGYPASGYGPGEGLDLKARVKAVYTQLTDDQVSGFILRQRVDGKSGRDIVNLLNTRLREWQTLEAALDQWVAEGPPARRDMAEEIYGRRRIVSTLKNSWQMAPLADLPQFARLDLYFSEPLPALQADFSHIRQLRVGGHGLADNNVEALLATFPKVERLQISVTNARMTRMPDALQNLSQLTELTISVDMPGEAFASAEVEKLERMTQLQSLDLDRVLEVGRGFDASRLMHLRSLTLSGLFNGNWPTGVLELPHLQRLNLKRASIHSLPAELYTPGHEQLWRGLSLDWSGLDRQSFKTAYDYLGRQSEHWVDREEMVSEYCRGALKRFKSEASRSRHRLEMSGSDLINEGFLSKWSGAQARFEAIEALSTEHAELTASLRTWTDEQQVTADDLMNLANPRQKMQIHSARVELAEDIQVCWYQGLMQTYTPLTPRSVLTLDASVLDDLPILPTNRFDNVQEIRLLGGHKPIPRLHEFISVFRGLRKLDLSHSTLETLPISADDVPQLEILDCAGATLNTLDVRGFSQLQRLDLKGATLAQWPIGIEQLSQLKWLDVRGTGFTTLPAGMLSSDDLLLNSRFDVDGLDDASQAALTQEIKRLERTLGLPDETLKRFLAQEGDDSFPVMESGSSIAANLLPRTSPLPAGSGPVWRTRCMQRLRPDLSAEQVQRELSGLAAQGLSNAQIDARLIDSNRVLDALTQELNGWLFVRQSSGRGWKINAQSRSQAAAQIIDCWRQGVLDAPGMAPYTLDLNGLQTGDLPALAGDFTQVGRLDLTGVRITPQGSNGFLRAFPNLRTLTLNGQALSELPEVLADMALLERLDLASIDLTDVAPLYPVLRRLRNLRALDLGYNNLNTFSVDQLGHLEQLDLSHNLLGRWPEGALQAPQLRRLNLSGNEITDLPAGLFDGSHETLLAGTDLSDNLQLSAHSRQQVREYADRQPMDRQVLGMSRDELRSDSEPGTDDSDADEQPPESDEDIAPVSVEAMAAQLEPWLQPLPEADRPAYRALWQRLTAEPEHEAFFHLLLLMQDTEEFRQVRADLTRRVWSLLESAERDTELREVLFQMSKTHNTCADGRTLAFSDLEVKTFEHEALRDIPAGLEPRGRALMNLSRKLFRLGQVEKLADLDTVSGHDKAEVRLSYRIGTASGWRDGLQLPGQPRYMRYARPIQDDLRDSVLREVEQAETTDTFYDDLISRPYWVRYLQDKYPQPFAALKQRGEAQREQVEAAYTDLADPAYAQAMLALKVEQTTERNLSLLQFSREEEAAFAPAARGPDLEVLHERAIGARRELLRARATAIEFDGRTYFVASMPDAGDAHNYLLWVPAPNDPQTLVSSGIIARADLEGVWRRDGRPGGMVSGQSDDEFELASESLPIKPYTAQELSAMRRDDHFTTGRNVIGSYIRANNGKYPLRDYQGRPIRIRKLEREAVVVESGVRYSSLQVKPYIKFGGYEDVAYLYEEKLQVRTFTAEDVKIAGEQSLVGQLTVVANRRIAKGEVVGVYGGTVLPRGLYGSGGNAFTMTVGSRAVYEAGRYVTEPVSLSGDNILSRINTRFDYDANGNPVRQAAEGYNVETIPFHVETDMLLGVAPAVKTVKKDFLLNTVWATEDIPAGAELRLDYGYTEAMIKAEFQPD